MRFTDEQRFAIEHRSGELLLDAGAGSGKTSVLVERFCRAVVEDGLDVRAILTITFTEKAAGELRERIRSRLQALGAGAAARDAEGAWISTIHAFCARVLRTHALAAGLDPAFAVLEPGEAGTLSGAAFDGALAAAAATGPGAELIAAHGPGPLRAAIIAVHAELRSRGQRSPSLPPAPSAAAGELERAREAVLAAARMAAAELGAIADPSVRVVQALDALERAEPALAAGDVWPGDLYLIGIPARNGATALRTEACDGYREALDALRTAAARGFALVARDGLDALLRGYAERYAALKTERSAVDFEDLELFARDLLARPEIGGRYRERFGHVMVDELQDTNRVQFQLIDSVAGGNLFMVGDAQQSIYGFRHAEVELFQERGRALEARGERASLQTNFRSRPQILAALNVAFERALGDRFRPLRAGRTDPEGGGGQAGVSLPRVELHIVDKGADWEDEGLAAPWRLAEARVLAARVRALIEAGEHVPGEIVVLTRATTDLVAYERALERAGVPTYVIGGRGYWSHPQVVAMLAYLRALANPLDAEAYLTVLGSPLCGLSLDGVVLVAAGADDELSATDAARLAAFTAWFATERAGAARRGVETLLERALEHTGYDAFVLGLPGGRRRLANVRKLMRLGREWEAAAGTALRGFLTLIEHRGAGVDRDGEAPVESEALDAVRLMTIHRAKGLEFPVTCVADLGRGPTFRAPLIRIGRDGRALGLRVGRPGSGAKINALDYDRLREEQQAASEAEERRLFYVAMTRARERLILSGAARMNTWEKGNRSAPVDWIVPAFVPDVAARIGEPVIETDLVRLTFVTEAPGADLDGQSDLYGACVHPSPGGAPAEPASEGAALGSDAAARGVAELGLGSGPPGAATELGLGAGPAVATLSYSALAEYERCGYRFYAERVLGLPPASEAGATGAPGAPGAPDPANALARGTLVHELLQRVDFRRPAPPAGTPEELAPMIAAFLESDLAARLARARDARREQRFAFPLGPVAGPPAGGPGTLVTGTFDVLATERDGGLLVVDYKTGSVAPYAVQRLIYAVAALRTGAPRCEIAHAFLEAAETVTAAYTAADRDALEAELAVRAAPVLAGRFPVADEPRRSLCEGCPALGGLCSWPAEVALRASPDRLF